MAKLKAKLEDLSKAKQDLQHKLELIQKSTSCDYCGKALKEPVTSIPCGHSFCLGCKKGYEKECCKCPGLKREAVYRNELLDEVVGAGQAIEKVISQLK